MKFELSSIVTNLTNYLLQIVDEQSLPKWDFFIFLHLKLVWIRTAFDISTIEKVKIRTFLWSLNPVSNSKKQKFKFTAFIDRLLIKTKIKTNLKRKAEKLTIPPNCLLSAINSDWIIRFLHDSAFRPQKFRARSSLFLKIPLQWRSWQNGFNARLRNVD